MLGWVKSCGQDILVGAVPVLIIVIRLHRFQRRNPIYGHKGKMELLDVYIEENSFVSDGLCSQGKYEGKTLMNVIPL